MRNNPSLTLADIQAVLTNTIKAAVDPLSSQMSKLTEKVDTLTADHVKQIDMQDLRREMQQGFAGLETKYLSREMAEQQRKELVNGQEDIRKELKDMKDAAASSGLKQWQMLSIVASIIFTFLGFLISLYANVLVHLSYK